MLSFVKPLVFLIWLISFSCYSKDTPDNWLGNRFLLQPVLYLYLVNLTINSSAKALTHMHFCCHLLFCWCCLTFTTDDVKSAEIAFCSLMGPRLPMYSSRIQFITFLWIGCANNIIRYISAWKKPCFYHCFPSFFLQWIGWLVSNILYWCWAVSQHLLVRFSSCFIYLIRNFLLKKIIMKTHFPSLRIIFRLSWNHHVDFKFSWDFPKQLFECTVRLSCLRWGHQVVMPLEGITWAGYTAPSEIQSPLMNLRIGTPNCCHSLKGSWYPV